MADIRTTTILPLYEAKDFDNPPIFDSVARKKFWVIDAKLDYYLKKMRSKVNKLGFVLQAGYFKASGKFFDQDSYIVDDIKYNAKKLGVDKEKLDLSNYSNKKYLEHKNIILNIYNFKSFKENKSFFDQSVAAMVEKQMTPRKIVYGLIDLLCQNKIEIPRYDQLARGISEHIMLFESELLSKIKSTITHDQQEIMDELLKSSDIQRQALLTKLQYINQSMRPKKIKASLSRFLMVRKLYDAVSSLVKDIGITRSATHYWATLAIKSKLSQIKDIRSSDRLYLYLSCFISHQFRVMQDNLVDVFLKGMQHQINKAWQDVDAQIIANTSRRNNLTSRLLEEHKKIRSCYTDNIQIRDIIYNEQITDSEKLIKIKAILPPIGKETTNEIDDVAKLLETELAKDDKNLMFLEAISLRSIKIRNIAAGIVKYLALQARDTEDSLMKALNYYQNNSQVTKDAPKEFLNIIESELIYAKEGFNRGLYESILFKKIMEGIKSATISLQDSYNYMSIDDYMIDQESWEKDKDRTLKLCSLDCFGDIDFIMDSLKTKISDQYRNINNHIKSNKNQYVKFKDDGKFIISTPPLDKPDYETIIKIIGENRYVSILEMMGSVDAATCFSKCFMHYKFKSYNKTPPESRIYMAGIFAIGTNIGLSRLSSSAIGINSNVLSHAVNWYFSLENLYAVNQNLVSYMNKMWLPNYFKKDKDMLHTSSDGKKRAVSVDSLNANYSYKYLGHRKGSNIYNFIDERGILFYTSVFSSSDRDAPHVIDGLLHDKESVKSDMHSTDTHGFTEMIFGVTYLLHIYFAPRIKNIEKQMLVSIGKIKNELSDNGHSILPSRAVNTSSVKKSWDDVLRLIATIKLGRCKASTILKRISGLSNKHPLKRALQEFGRVIRSKFMLEYIDNLEFRQSIEKQLNKGELSNLFNSAVSFAKDEIRGGVKEDQERESLCRVIVQNIIILWNYLELSKIIMKENVGERARILDEVKQGSIMSWRHVNLFGTYNFNQIDKKYEVPKGSEMFDYTP